MSYGEYRSLAALGLWQDAWACACAMGHPDEKNCAIRDWWQNADLDLVAPLVSWDTWKGHSTACIDADKWEASLAGMPLLAGFGTIDLGDLIPPFVRGELERILPSWEGNEDLKRLNLDQILRNNLEDPLNFIGQDSIARFDGLLRSEEDLRLIYDAYASFKHMQIAVFEGGVGACLERAWETLQGIYRVCFDSTIWTPMNLRWTRKLLGAAREVILEETPDFAEYRKAIEGKKWDDAFILAKEMRNPRDGARAVRHWWRHVDRSVLENHITWKGGSALWCSSQPSWSVYRGDTLLFTHEDFDLKPLMRAWLCFGSRDCRNSHPATLAKDSLHEFSEHFGLHAYPIQKSLDTGDPQWAQAALDAISNDPSLKSLPGWQHAVAALKTCISSVGPNVCAYSAVVWATEMEGSNFSDNLRYWDKDWSQYVLKQYRATFL